MGLFITFEGSDGSGKTTQSEMLVDKLISMGYSVLKTREPGGTAVAEKIREILLYEDKENISDRTEALLYAAARAQHVQEIIKPALAEGKIVVSDRYLDSSLVYQGMARGLGVEEVKKINEMALDNTCPDLTILIDLDVKTSMQRLEKRTALKKDRLEEEDINFKEKIRSGYLSLASAEPERIKVIESTTIEETFDSVWNLVESFLAGRQDVL